MDAVQAARWGGILPESERLRAPYSIVRVDSAGQQSILMGPEAGLSSSNVQLDATPDGVVYVSTETETFTIGPDGTRTSATPHRLGHPVLAVNPSGALLTIAPPLSDSTDSDQMDVEWLMDAGSAEARKVLAEKGVCQGESAAPVTVSANGRSATLPFTCNAGGAAWISDTQFVVAIGDEGGTVLAKVDLPASWAD